MKLNKKMRCIVLAMTLAAVLSAGCGKTWETGTKQYVALVTKSTESAFWKAVYAGAGAAATEYNLDISFEGPEREEDYQTQNEMIKRAINQELKPLLYRR